MTCQEAFQKLPKTVAQKAIRNLKNRPIIFKEQVMGLDSECKNLQDAILNFNWSKTAEGSEYWWRQYKKAEGK